MLKAHQVSLLLFTACCACQMAQAQVPGVPAATDPGKKNPPAEIVPAAPASTPAAGAKTSEPPAASLSPGSKATTPAPAKSAREAVDALSESELDEVITAIKQRYIAPGALTDAAIKRATVQGLLERLGASATLVLPGSADSKVSSVLRSEVLNERIGYVRLGAFDEANLQELDKQLAALAQKGIEAWIIDLRATPESGDFERAAEVCRRFCPKGKLLFTLKRPESKQNEIFTTKEEPRVRGLLTVLTDASTAGSAEVVAGTLRSLAKAVIIGQKTKGAAAEFAEVPLQDGRKLRLAVAEVLLPGDVSVVPDGVKPDVAVDVSKETEESVLARELESGVAPFITETERVRLNEAALVAGTNPELDQLQTLQGTKGQKPKGPQRDVILQRAVDLETSLSVFEKGAKK